MKRGYVIDYGSTSLLMATSGKLISNYIAPLLLCARLMIPSHQYIISFRKFFQISRQVNTSTSLFPRRLTFFFF